MSDILGLGGGYYHDSSACLVRDGAVVAFAEEERFSRRKHNADSRSCAGAAAYCLDHGGIELGDVDGVAVAWNAEWPQPVTETGRPELVQELLGGAAPRRQLPRALHVVDHHLAHAASAFYCSGFADAAILVVDGSGDGISTSVCHGTSRGVEILRQYPFSQSLGWFYEAVAAHIGFGKWTNVGKMMGLAAYGRPCYDLDFVEVRPDGYGIDLSRYGLGPDEDVAGQYADFRYYWRFQAACGAALADAGVPAQDRARCYDRGRGGLVDVTEFGREHVDLAASAQHTLERCLLALARDALATTGSTSLCVAGGVGLSCSANGVLQRQAGARRFFAQPVAGDSGTAIGAALELARRRGELGLPAEPMRSAALGPEFPDALVGDVLAGCGLDAVHAGGRAVDLAADALAAGRVVAWFQGRLEAGPRALGQRSILGDPRSTAVRDRINRDIKRREPWRPLAPSILDTGAGELVDRPGPAEFMIVAYPATERAAESIPGVVHVDRTLRPQVVPAAGGTPYAALLRAFEERTGVPALLNTSFNHEAEPIVCTPVDAIRTFQSTPVDMLVMGGHVLTKPGSGGRC